MPLNGHCRRCLNNRARAAPISLGEAKAAAALVLALHPAFNRPCRNSSSQSRKTQATHIRIAFSRPATRIWGDATMQRSTWLAHLSGPALEEAQRPIERHLALAQRLQRLGMCLLPWLFTAFTAPPCGLPSPRG